MPVPAALIAERHVVLRLMRANAVSPEMAQPLDDLRWMDRRMLKRLIAADVVREAAPGRYSINAPALADRVTARRRRAALVLALVLVVFALAFYVAGAAATTR